MNTISQTDKLSEQWSRRKRPESLPLTLRAMFCRRCYSVQLVKTTNNGLTTPRAWLACGHSRANDGESR
jgi:hypothetical protein